MQSARRAGQQLVRVRRRADLPIDDHVDASRQLASVSQPSRSRMVSAAPASTACWRSSTLASSATDLMSQRAQRVSSR